MEADRVPPCNLCPRLKCFVWDAGGGAEGREGVNTAIHIHGGEG